MKCPILYFNDFSFLVFNGRSDYNSIRYRDVVVKLGFDDSIVSKANRIKVEKNSVLFFKDNVILKRKEFDLEPLILSFDNKL